MTQATSLALFCKVVDNFGDIGICWRFARQLAQEHGIEVTLWVDDLHTFQRICPEVQTGAALQRVGRIAVRHWATQEGQFAPAEIADIVIEFFGCDIPPGYITAMAQCEPRPVWLNLEGLSAEEWVEGCHTLPSMHPSFSLTKHFFFPGFTDKTGGLLREAALEEERQQFQADPAAMAAFLGQFDLTAQEIAARKLTLFCYPHAPVSQLFKVWEEGDEEIVCLVPQGVASQAVHAFLDEAAIPGAVRRRGALTVRVLPFVPQQDYDKLLWASDLNFVRGEDSVVRAQWAGKPFIWHIYPQDENLHHKKLRAFLQRYAAGSASLEAFSLYWNGARPQGGAEVADWAALWRGLRTDMAALTQHSVEWQHHLYTLGDLTTNLLKFSSSLR